MSATLVPASPGSPAELDLCALADEIRAGDRAALARAITMVESRRADHRAAAAELLAELAPDTGEATRVGLSGPPGAGKSTLLERLGNDLCDAGRRVAVLAVDPSSTLRGGSILADKTRMASLAARPEAYIRPSPSGGASGGVHERTRETIALCEAAGYDVLIVETVGVGQSEAAVATLVDTLVLLQIPGTGDELQGLKKGVLEVADIIAINKADGDNLVRARRARRDFRAALHLVRPRSRHWSPPVMLLSGATGRGVGELWERIRAHRDKLLETGELDARRAEQRRAGLWQEVERSLLARLRTDPGVARQAGAIEAEVAAGKMPVAAAAERILETFLESSP